MTDNDSWVCPYCNQPTTITNPNIDGAWHLAKIAESRIMGKYMIGYRGTIIACPNQGCKQLFFKVQLKKGLVNAYGQDIETDTVINEWILLPDSVAKPQPAYIPKQVVQDYTEACRIKDLSPKASATLSRRCLQGMIRDFWDVSVKSKKLSDEINELKNKVDTNELAAIDAVRSVGNIGAHMEQDVNLIIDVEPAEADMLIRLIEDLFKDWYIARHDKEERQKEIINLARSKNSLKKNEKLHGK